MTTGTRFPAVHDPWRGNPRDGGRHRHDRDLQKRARDRATHPPGSPARPGVSARRRTATDCPNTSKVIGKECNLGISPRSGGKTVAGIPLAVPPGADQTRRSRPLARRELFAQRRRHRSDDRCHRQALGVYKRAMENGVDRYLVGSPSSVVFRKYNHTPAASLVNRGKHDTR